MALPNDLSTMDYADGGLPFSGGNASAGLPTSSLDVADGGLPFATNALASSTDNARITQVAREVLRDNDDPGGGNLRVSQVAREVLSGAEQYVRVTQVAREVLSQYVGAAAEVGRGTSWMVFQKDAFIDVTLTGTAPTSAASDVAVLNGANLLAVGYELLQFKTVTPLGGNRYRLSYLLRGRFGTEWAMNSHMIGERVVLLTEATTRRLTDSESDIGRGAFYKAVSAGQDFNSAVTISGVNTGISLRPYAPVHVKGTRDGSNNLTITWYRRTRISGEWRDYVEVPLAEITEAYEIEVINPSTSTVARTITASTTTATYTAAEQTTDFGSVQNSITIWIYQISATVGRGFATIINL